MTLRDLAEKYSALETVDKSDFQRSARILQSMWRAEQGYEIGELKTRSGSKPLGSRLVMPWAQETRATPALHPDRNCILIPLDCIRCPERRALPLRYTPTEIVF